MTTKETLIEECDDDKLADALIRQAVNKAYKEKKDSVEYQLDIDKTITNILLWSGGYIYNSIDNKIYKRKENTAPVNSTGLIRIAGILHTYVTKDTILSNLSMPEIKRIMLDLGSKLLVEMSSNQKKYGINNATFRLTYTKILDAIFITLKRAYDGTTLKHLETVMKVHETVKESSKEKDDKGVWGNR